MMKKENEKRLEELKEEIAEAIVPRKMSVAEAREFLEELVGDLKMQIESLPEEEG